ncbi:MAG: branched-chain amino acid ABC transporter permease, partial [Candidatus Methanomethylicota archaeon]
MIPEAWITWIMDVLVYFAVYLIVVVSLNLQYGYTGIPNFGLALSVAGGAYVAGSLAGRIAMWYYGIGEGLDFIRDNSFITSMLNERLAHDPVGGIILFLALIGISSVINAGLGFIASYPAIRLRADYLIMTLIAMAEAIRVIGINYYPLVGGTFWVHVPDYFAWTGDMRRIVITGLIFGIALIMFFIVQIFATSPLGRLIRAIRENEVSAECLGKDVTK